MLANDAVALRALLTGLAQEPESDSCLRKLEAPCLLLAGERDVEYLRVRAAADLMSNAKFVSLPALTHGASFFVSHASLPHVRSFLANSAQSVDRRSS